MNSDTDFEFIENKIKQRWVLPDTNEHASVADLSIENYVITYLREHTHAVLIIDDAHLLNTDTLDRLFTLKHRISLACPLSLGFILAGENTLKISISELEDSNPACTQVYQINVRPFSREQTGHYIEHRLQTAGSEDEVLLDEAMVTEIYKSTLGNIRKIHERAIVALLNQCREDSLEDPLDPHIIIRKPKPKVPVFLITILAIIGVGLYANYYMSRDKTDEIIVPLEKPLASEPTLSPIVQKSDSSAGNQAPSLPLPNTAVVPTDPKNNSVINAPLVTTKDDTSLLSESIEVLDEKQLLTLKAELTEKAVAAKDKKPESVETAVKPTVTQANPKPANNSSAIATKGEAWLKGLSPSSYTLQVVATKDIKQLESLVKKENLVDKYAYFDKQVKGSTYYVLVIGNYETRDKALAALEKLSANLRKNKPWPVPLKNIQSFLD